MFKMRLLLHVVTLCLFVSATSITVGRAQNLPRDPIIRNDEPVDTTFLSRKGFNQQYRSSPNSSRYALYSGLLLADLQTFLYKQSRSPWRLGLSSGLNFAYCGSWQGTFGAERRDNSLYNGAGIHLTLNADYYLSAPGKWAQLGLGSVVGYQNYFTRSGLGNEFSPAQIYPKPEVTVTSRPSQDFFVLIGPVVSFPFTQSRRYPLRRSVLELGARGGLFSTNAAIIAATVSSQNDRLIRSVGPASEKIHGGGLLSLGVFVPLNDRWQLGFQAQGFYTGLNYLIVNGSDSQEYRFYRKHGGFSIGLALRKSFPRRQLIPSDTTNTKSAIQELDTRAQNLPRDPIIKNDEPVDTTYLSRNSFKQRYRSGPDAGRYALYGGLLLPNLQTFLYKQSRSPWQLGFSGGVNLAYCGLWENSTGPNEPNNMSYNGAGLNLTGNADYVLSSVTRRLRIGLGVAFGYQNYATRRAYRDALYKLAETNMPAVGRDQVSIRQGASVHSYVTLGPLITYAFGKRANTLEVALRGGLFRTEAATISAFVPSFSTRSPSGPLVESGELLRRVSPDARLYHPGGTLSLGIFVPIGKNLQVGIQAQGFYTQLNYLIIDGISRQVTPHIKPYTGLSTGAALRILLPRRRLVPVAVRHETEQGIRDSAI